MSTDDKKCLRCEEDMDPGSERELCDQCWRCIECGLTADQTTIEGGICDDCWAQGKAEGMALAAAKEGA